MSAQKRCDLLEANLLHAAIMAEIHLDSFDAPWSEQAFITLLSQPVVSGWIGLEEEPVGFVLTRSVANESEILTIAIRKTQRRKGFAHTLLFEALTKIKENGSVVCHLEVADDNAAGLALYGRMGFQETGRRERYYRRSTGAVDAVLMTKRLDVMDLERR